MSTVCQWVSVGWGPQHHPVRPGIACDQWRAATVSRRPARRPALPVGTAINRSPWIGTRTLVTLETPCFSTLTVFQLKHV